MPDRYEKKPTWDIETRTGRVIHHAGAVPSRELNECGERPLTAVGLMRLPREERRPILEAAVDKYLGKAI